MVSMFSGLVHLGYSERNAWRHSFALPACLLVLAAAGVLALGTDSPKVRTILAYLTCAHSETIAAHFLLPLAVMLSPLSSAFPHQSTLCAGRLSGPASGGPHLLQAISVHHPGHAALQHVGPRAAVRP